MHFEITGPYKADEIFILTQARQVEGLPDFANLKADRLGQWKGTPEVFKGPGLYGAFCKGKLYYVGIYTGSQSRTFAGSVLQRWYMHLTYHSVRSPEVRFARRELQKILSGIYGEPADSIARLVGGRDADIAMLNHENTPLIQKYGGSCTSNKVRFAQRNWDVFAPGNEDLMGSEVSFVYGRFLPSCAGLLGENFDSSETYRWAKNEWLRQPESRLVKGLKPICNAETSQFRDDVSVDEFIAALRDEMDRPPPPYPQLSRAA